MFPSFINFFWLNNKEDEPPQPLNDAILNPASYNNIATYLYLGNIDSLQYASKFALIVNCTTHIEFPEKTSPTQMFIRIPVLDSPTECSKLLIFIKETQVLEKIHFCRTANRSVLVHCHAGMQRSCAVIACYLMKYYNMPLNDAIAFIKKRRPIAFYQTANFMNAMMQFEYSLKMQPK